MGNMIGIAAYPNKRFHIIIPGRNILIADWTVNAMAIAEIGFKIQVAPAVTGSSPQQRTTANNIASYPVEAFCFFIRILPVVNIKMLVVFAVRIMAALYEMIILIFLRKLLPVRKIPGVFVSSRVVTVLNIAATVEQQ